MRTHFVDGGVVAKLTSLQPGEIPEHLQCDQPQRRESDFDPNTYFKVLTHLSMKPGYTLDYVYHWMKDFGGDPCLYARKTGDAPLATFEEYRNWAKGNPPLLDYLVADGTPDSYFQLLVFRLMAQQFYLYYHAHYDDFCIVTTRAEVDGLASVLTLQKPAKILPPYLSKRLLVAGALSSRFSKKAAVAFRKEMAAMDPRPTVTFSARTAVVRSCGFSKWGGLVTARESRQRCPPHQLCRGKVLAVAVYDCGFMF